MRILYKESRYVLSCLHEMFQDEGEHDFEDLNYDTFYNHVQDTYIRDEFKWNLKDWVKDLKTYNSRADDN